MAEEKIDPERIAHKQSFEWQGVILPNGKTMAEEYGVVKDKDTKKPDTKKK